MKTKLEYIKLFNEFIALLDGTEKTKEAIEYFNEKGFNNSFDFIKSEVDEKFPEYMTVAEIMFYNQSSFRASVNFHKKYLVPPEGDYSVDNKKEIFPNIELKNYIPEKNEELKKDFQKLFGYAPNEDDIEKFVVDLKNSPSGKFKKSTVDMTDLNEVEINFENSVFPNLELDDYTPDNDEESDNSNDGRFHNFDADDDDGNNFNDL